MQGQVCIYVPASGCFLSNHPVSHKGNCCTCNRILELRGAFEHWMHQNANAENRLLVVGNNDQARKMITEVHQHYKDKRIIEMLGSDAKKYFPLRKIRASPLFQPKRKSSAVILADFCAYIWKKLLMEDRRYERFSRSFREQ